MTNEQDRPSSTVGRVVGAAMKLPVLRELTAAGIAVHGFGAVAANERRQRGPRATWLDGCRVPGVAPHDETEHSLSYRTADLLDRPAVAAALASLPVRGPGFRDDETDIISVRDAVFTVGDAITVHLEQADLGQDGTTVEGEEPQWSFDLFEEDLAGLGLELDGFDGACQVTSLLNREPGMVVATEVDDGCYELTLNRPVPADEVLAMVVRAVGTAYRAAAHERGIVTADLPEVEGAAALDRVRAAAEAEAPLPPDQTRAFHTQIEDRLTAAGFRTDRPGAGHRTCGELLQTVSVNVSREGNRPVQAEVSIAVHDRSVLAEDQIQEALDGSYRPRPLVHRTWTVAASTPAVIALLGDTALPSADGLATRAAVIAHWEHNPGSYSWMDAVQHVDSAARWKLPSDATRLLHRAVRQYGRFDEARTAYQDAARRHGLPL